MANSRLMMLRSRAAIAGCWSGFLAVGRRMSVVVATLLVVMVAGFVTPASAQDTNSVMDPVDLAPELAVVVDGLGSDDVDRPLERLESLPGIGRATWDRLDDNTTVFYLSRSVGSGPSAEALGRQAAADLQTLLPDAEILVGGAGIVDAELSQRYRSSTVWLVLLAAAVGAAIGSAFGGWKRMALAGGALTVAVLLAASIGSQVAGPFNGTMTTTAIPGALAGLVAGTAVTLRLLARFRDGFNGDGATAMRTAIFDLVPELALVTAGLAVTAFIVEFLDPGRSPLTVIVIASLAAILVVMAIMTPVLAVLGPSGPARLPLSFPDGRDFPLLVVLAIAAVLVALSLFAFAGPAPKLIGEEALDDDTPASLVAERLLAGDPTTALVALRPASVSPEDFQGWAGAVVERAEVAWVDTGAGRLTSTGQVEVAETTLLVDPGRDDVVVVVPAVTARSIESQELAGRLTGIPLAGGPADFDGEASESARVVGSLSTNLTALVLLALVAGGSLLVMTQNRALAGLAVALRLIGGGATLGMLRLMVNEVTAAESVTALGVLALGLGLYELEFLRPVVGPPGQVVYESVQRTLVGASVGGASAGGDEGLTAGTPGEDGQRFDGLPPDRKTTNLNSRLPLVPNRGQYAGIATATLVPAGLLLGFSAVLGGGPGTGQFGLALLAVTVIEVLVGMVLLRPALLGQRAAYHSAVRPVRVAMHSGIDLQRQKSLGAEDPVWRRTVGDLLQAEFRLQSDPASAELDSVFVPDTPLHKQAAAHHASLAEANLKIVGRSPQLRTLKTVSGRSSVTLTVTVDHPARNLVAGDGSVVGFRKPERRSGVLWLSPADDGSFRIAESVELGSVYLPEDGTEPDDQAGGVADGPPIDAEPVTQTDLTDVQPGPVERPGSDGQTSADGAGDPAEV